MPSNNSIAELDHKIATTIDKIEAAIISTVNEPGSVYKLVDCPLVHTFTDKLYSRQITMPSGTLVTSETHLTEHQFVVSKGVVSVWTEEGGEVIIEAPFHGITKPGTRRVLYIHDECVWTTFHSTLLHTVDDIYNDIIEKYENPLYKGRYKNNVFIPDENLSINN